MTPSPSRTARVLLLGLRLVTGYQRLQISHRGSYSLERLQALQAYRSRTSLTRAVLICVALPLPPLLVMLLMESIPLQDPAAGWRANYTFWVRFFLSCSIVCLGLTIQIKAMVTGLHLSISRTLGVSMGTAAVYTATLLGIASGWVFPIPFGIVVGAVPALVFYVSFLILGIGRHALMTSPDLGKQLRLQTYVVGVQTLLVLVYPAFSSLFFAVTSTNRIGLVLVLPIIKLLMKNVVAWASSHLEDYVPVIVVFSVEVFNALYVATCMQTANSWLATVVIIAFDGLHAVLTFLALHLRTRSIQKQRLKLRQLRWMTTQEPEDLLTTVLQLCHQPQVLESREATAIRLRSPLKLQISMAQNKVLDKLVGRQAVELTQQTDQWDTKRTIGFRPHQVLSYNDPKRASAPPLNRPPALQIGSTESESHQKRRGLHTQPTTEEQHVLVIQDALKLLFECEYHALVEYVECAVPTLYGVYLTILCHLPNGQYYAHIRAMQPGQLQATLLTLGVYVALEMLSFAAMHIVLKRKLGLSPLHQLAFVLETQMLQLQGRLFVWVIFILQFTLQHLGVDFTFRFDWMQPRNQ
ncbi:hypothetical protein BBJ28_00014516 [Nothophytophthora sp. Chile5]|nr:hypothetical protein BBJ28_00014516 [Nothophytophthora sp. Chile5]